MAQQLKTCITCGEHKPLEQYSKASRRPDGLQASCKACNKISNRKFRESRPEYQNKYYRTPDGHKAKLKAQQKFWEKDGGGIYIIKNKENGKVYIGQTSKYNRREIEWKVYFTHPDGHSHYLNAMFFEDVKHYGIEAFEFIRLEPMLNATTYQRKKRENFYINLFSLVGQVYNVTRNKLDGKK